MNGKSSYHSNLEVLRGISSDQVVYPKHIPVEVYIQEAIDLKAWCSEDISQLQEFGMSAQLVEDLTTRYETLREAQSIWETQRYEKKEHQLRWAEEKPEAIELRNLLIQSFRFAFRKRPELLKHLRAVSGSVSQEGLISSLNALSVLGEAQSGLLSVIHFDSSLLLQAKETASRIGLVQAQARHERTFGNDSLDIRNRAYTHLKMAVDEINAYGCFAFRKNPDRLRGYRSHHLRKIRLSRKIETLVSSQSLPSGQPVESVKAESSSLTLTPVNSISRVRKDGNGNGFRTDAKERKGGPNIPVGAPYSPNFVTS